MKAHGIENPYSDDNKMANPTHGSLTYHGKDGDIAVIRDWESIYLHQISHIYRILRIKATNLQNKKGYILDMGITVPMSRHERHQPLAKTLNLTKKSPKPEEKGKGISHKKHDALH